MSCCVNVYGQTNKGQGFDCTNLSKQESHTKIKTVGDLWHRTDFRFKNTARH